MSLTSKEKRTILELRRQGVSKAEIARTIDCHRNTVDNLLKKVGDPYVAQQGSNYPIPDGCLWDTLRQKYTEVPQTDVREQLEEELQTLAENNKNALILVTGKPGAGKSYNSINLCQIIDQAFDIDRIVFTKEQLAVIIPETSNGSIMLDDCQRTLGAKEWWEVKRRAIHESMSVSRHRGLSILINAHDLRNIDKPTRLLLHYEIHITCQCGDHVDAILYRITNTGDDAERLAIGMMRYYLSEYDQALNVRYEDEKSKYLALIEKAEEEIKPRLIEDQVKFTLYKNEELRIIKATYDEIARAIKETPSDLLLFPALLDIFESMYEGVQQIKTWKEFQDYENREKPEIGKEVAKRLLEYKKVKDSNDLKAIQRMLLTMNFINLQKQRDDTQNRLHYLQTVDPIKYLWDQRIIVGEAYTEDLGSNIVQGLLVGSFVPVAIRGLQTLFSPDNSKQPLPEIPNSAYLWSSSAGAVLGSSVSHRYKYHDGTLAPDASARLNGFIRITQEKEAVTNKLTTINTELDHAQNQIDALVSPAVPYLDLHRVLLPYHRPHLNSQTTFYLQE